MPARTENVLLLGCGYVGRHLLEMGAAQHDDWQWLPVSREMTRVRRWRGQGLHALHMADDPSSLDAAVLREVTVIVDSIPLDREMRAVQPNWLAALLARCPNLRQAIYLSSSSVYGDASGAWVDESWPCRPTSRRGQQRLQAERCWRKPGVPLSILRLAGIYGPERNLARRLRAGNYQAVAWEPARYANRVHVEDIARCLLAAIERRATGIFNISDDLPLPHAEYVQRLASLLGAPAPEILAPEEASKRLPARVLDFFRDSKRLDNRRMHRYLCEHLRYPDFTHYFRVKSEAD